MPQQTPVPLQSPTRVFFESTAPRILRLDPALGSALGNISFLILGEGAWTLYGADARVTTLLDASVGTRITLLQAAFEAILVDETTARPLFAVGAAGAVVTDALVAESLYTLFRRAREEQS